MFLRSPFQLVFLLFAALLLSYPVLADTLHIPEASEWDDFSALPNHPLASGSFSAGAGATLSEISVTAGALDDGAAADSGYFLHRVQVDSGEIQLNLVTPSPTGLSGLMIRDSIDEDAAFLFVGIDVTGETVVMRRKEAGASIETVFRETRNKQWLRLIVGRDTVYVYDSAQRYNPGNGAANWGAAIGMWSVSLAGEDVGGVFVENGTAEFAQLFETRPYLWNERVAETDAAVLTGNWTFASPTAGQEAISDSLYSIPADTMSESVEIPLSTKTPGNYDFRLHLPAGNPASINVEIEINGTSLGYFPYTNPDPTTSSWIFLDQQLIEIPAGQDDADISVHVWSEIETDPANQIYGPGDTLFVDAAMMTLQRPTDWNYLGWNNKSYRLKRSNYGEPGNYIYRDNANNIDWNAGAHADSVIVGDGTFLMRLPKHEKRTIAGVTNTPGGNGYTNIPWRFYGKSNKRVIAQGGISDPESFYDSSTWLGIERIGGRILFWKNSGLRGMSANESLSPIGFDCSIKDNAGRVSSARVKGFYVPRAVQYDIDGDEDDYTDLDERFVIDASSDDEFQSVYDVGMGEDPDQDGLTNAEEYELDNPSNPTMWDTDGDGLSDGEEVNLYRTDPTLADSDFDRVDDGDEVAMSLRFDADAFIDVDESTFDAVFNPNKKNSDGNDLVGDATEYDIIEHQLENLGLMITDEDFISYDQINDSSDFDGDQVLDKDESEDRTSAVDADDYFFPMDFAGFGSTSGVTVTTDTENQIESTRMIRDANESGLAGGITHHRIKDGSRVRFRFPSPSLGASIGFTVLLVPEPDDPDYQIPGAQDFLTDIGNSPNYAISIESNTPGMARVIAEGQPLPIGDPNAGLYEFPIQSCDLLEIRMEVVGEGGRVVVEKNFGMLTEHLIDDLNLDDQPMVVAAFLPDETAEGRSVFANGRYRKMDDPDIDRDGLPDKWEQLIVDNDDDIDFIDQVEFAGDDDQDGLLNFEEYEWGTKGFSEDSDGDGMWDGWEAHYLLDPTDSSDAAVNDDDDELTNLEEFLNILKFGDSNQSWIYYGTTDPTDADSDDDGIQDHWESWSTGRNPLEQESDLDEIDSDEDGIPDVWEVAKNLDMNDPGDALRDDDYDHLTNAEEFMVDGDPFPIWTHREVTGGLGDYGVGPASGPLPFRDAAPGEGSLTAAGRLARVNNTGYDFQLEVWNGFDWEVKGWFGKVNEYNWSGHVRANDLNMAAGVFGKQSAPGAYPTDVELRIIDRFGILRTVGSDLNWKQISRLDLTNSGYVAGLAQTSDHTYVAFRWRLNELELVNVPGNELGTYGGITESGDWVEAAAANVLTSDEWQVHASASSSSPGEIFQSGTGTKVWAAGDGVLYRRNNGDYFGLTEAGVVALPVDLDSPAADGSPDLSLVLSDINAAGDVIGWWQDESVRDPASFDPIVGDRGFFWKGNALVPPAILGDENSTDFRYHQITDRGVILSSYLVTKQDEEEYTDENGETTLVLGDPYFERVWIVSHPNIDSDGNGLGDDWEAFHEVSSATDDDDNDGLVNAVEFALGTNPKSSHSDGDGLDDGFEVRSGFSATEDLVDEIDFDGDGLLAAAEAQQGGTRSRQTQIWMEFPTKMIQRQHLRLRLIRFLIMKSGVAASSG